ncbi:VHR1 [Cowpox virus]|uniref:VHR1 n=1 Tax=Cowpox virus TaxID=10243 RepID=U5TIL6_COWPX|nr:VHR1 [Cowpox virus]AGY99398.1 VHR1 [Cowpox virus]AGZ00252.1 VHR1 [Cowpox virus]AGZ00882.1 VHR1 [Cowpox virus]SNB48769.1 VHR1 [Cowpox virus]
MFDYLENEEVALDELKQMLKDRDPNDTRNQFKNNALHAYLFNEHCNNVEVVKLLLDSGTNPLHKNWRQLTPLEEYTNSRHVKVNKDIAMALLEATGFSNINDFNIFSYMKSKNVDVDLIKMLVEHGFDLSVKCENHRSVIENYVMTDDPVPEIIDLFIENGCSVLYEDEDEDEDDEYGYAYDDYQPRNCGTVLHLYIISHLYSESDTRAYVRPEVVKCLINHGIKPSSIDKNYCTALQYYIKSSHIDIDIVKLLMKGIDNTAYSYIDDLTCCTRGIMADYLNSDYRYNKDVDLDLVKLFLENGKPHGIMCSIVPLWRNDKETISLILKTMNSDVLQHILIEYMTFGDIDIPLVECMLEYGAVVNKEAIHGYFRNINIDSYTMKYLLKKEGGDAVNHLDDGEIPIGHLCKSNYGCYNFYTDAYRKGLCDMSYACPILSTINICLPYLKDINMIDKRGETLLHKAVRYNKQSLVSLLLESGSNVNIKSNNGYTCIAIAINESKNIELLKMLLCHKPTLDCVIDSLREISNIVDNDYAIKQCIKYAMIIDDCTSSKIPESISQRYNDYIDLCNQELNEMKKIMVGGNTMFSLIFTDHGAKIIHRYANNPELREYYESKQNKIYVEAYDIISDAIVKHDRIHKTIESVDDNTYISNLPYTIKYKIFEQQ